MQFKGAHVYEYMGAECSKLRAKKQHTVVGIRNKFDDLLKME